MKIKFRRVCMADIKSLLPLVNQLGYPTTEENLIARVALYQHSSNDHAWIATVNDEIIGCIALHFYDLFHSTERYARIVSLVVKDSYRRLGIGKRLIAKAERFAKQMNCSAIELSSSLKRTKDGVYDFYNKLGYNNDGEHQTHYLRKFLREKEGPLMDLNLE